MAGNSVDDNFYPPGWRFTPQNGELIEDYLKKKILGEPLPVDILPTVEVYSRDPTQLPLSTATYRRDKNVWYFFTIKPRNDSLMLTSFGYYSVIKEEKTIERGGREVGFMRTLAYFEARHGNKSKWTIYEFRVKPETIPSIQHDDALKEKVTSFLVCKLVMEEKYYTRKI